MSPLVPVSDPFSQEADFYRYQINEIIRRQLAYYVEPFSRQITNPGYNVIPWGCRRMYVPEEKTEEFFRELSRRVPWRDRLPQEIKSKYNITGRFRTR